MVGEQVVVELKDDSGYSSSLILVLFLRALFFIKRDINIIVITGTLVEVDAFMNLTVAIPDDNTYTEDVNEEGMPVNSKIMEEEEKEEEEEEGDEVEEEGCVNEDMLYIKGTSIRCVQLPDDIDLRSHVARFTKKLKQIAAQNAPRPIKGT